MRRIKRAPDFAGSRRGVESHRKGLAKLYEGVEHLSYPTADIKDAIYFGVGDRVEQRIKTLRFGHSFEQAFTRAAEIRLVLCCFDLFLCGTN